jgi:hypothetical protein
MVRKLLQGRERGREDLIWMDLWGLLSHGINTGIKCRI